MATDEYGGYYYNGTPYPRWGAGQQFASQQACYNACVSSGDAGCGACSYMEPPVITKRLEATTLPPQPTTTEPKTDDVLKIIIIAGIALILLAWS